MKRTSRLTLACGTALFLSASALPAVSQESPAPASPPAKPATLTKEPHLEEIVVTAQRVSKSLQKTPVAVTALSAAVLKDQGVTNILQLNALAPSVSVGTRSGSASSAGDITIRGIGINANPPASPSVGIYIDDVYFPGAYGNLLGLFDVSRVELLRGPQGTLFGRNTIAGALLYDTVKPKLDVYSGFVEDTVGNLNRNDVSAGLNIPIGSIAALRVEGGIQDRDGYVKELSNGLNLGAERIEQARVELHIEPNDRLTIDLKGEYLDEHSNGSPTISAGFNYNTILGGLYGPRGPFGPDGLNRYISPNDYTVVGLDAPDYAQTRFHIISDVIRYDITDQVALKSISAYSSNTSRAEYDQDGTPLPIISVTQGNVTDQLFTQEAQLIGHFFDDRLHVTLGAYFYNDRTTTIGQRAAIFGHVTDAFGDFANITHSYAAYGQATYNITSKLAIIGGLRYTTEQAGADDDILKQIAGRIFRNTSPMIGLTYQLTPDVLLYVKDDRGFRAGGFAPSVAGYFYYSPEHATTYEAGARMQFLDERLRVNPTIYYTNWDDIQFNGIVFVPGFPTPSPIIQNAGNASIKGAEIETEALLTNHLSVTVSGSLLNGHYTKIDPSQASNLTEGSGLARSPQSSYAVGAHYLLPLGDRRSLAFSANYAWQGHQRSETSDGDNVPIPAYGLLSARVEFKPWGDHLSFSLFGTNLTGQKYFVGGTNFGNGGVIPTDLIDIGPPREYGLVGRYSF